MPSVQRSTSFLVVGILGELALGFGGALFAYGTGIDWTSRLPRTWGEATAHSLAGVVAVVPTLMVLAWALHTPWPIAARLRELVEQLFGPLLDDASVVALALLAAAAAVGEEILFRGALQPWVAGKWGSCAAWLAISLLFGAVHAVSRAYFFFASCMGCYLGWLSDQQGLWPAIVVHFLYDFVALVAVRNRRSVGLDVGKQPDVSRN